MEDYNWKNHYAVELTELDNTGAFSHFRIDDGTGQGRVISCTVFPGIQAVYNDLYLLHCGKTVPKTEEIVEINYCAEGRYECDVISRMAVLEPRRFYIRGKKEIDIVCRQMISAVDDRDQNII